MSQAREPTTNLARDACPDQANVIDFLQQPSTYSPTPQEVTRIDTHAAIIFLAGDHAYKIKRAVKLSYLDFRSLDERFRVCQRELEINQTHAPQIYEDVIPVVEKTDGTLQLGGEGKVVEWVLRMRRFDQANILESLARHKRLDIDVMHALAETLVAAHAGAPVAVRHDGASNLREVIDTTLAAFENAPDILDAEAVRRFAHALTDTFEAAVPALKARAASGYVRRCHGDLHLQNIVLMDGTPTLFDALEFDEELATIDTLYDLAFLLMDLWHRSMHAHANALVNRYIHLSPNALTPEAFALLPLFLALRAAIRSMVALDALPHLEGRERDARASDARNYFRLANEFLHPPRPALIAIGGLSGTGKSTQAALIAPGIGAAPGACVLRSDVERKHMFHVPVETHLGDHAYAPGVSERVYAQLFDKAARTVRAGHTVIADAVFSTTTQRDAIEQIAREDGVPFVGLWLEAEQDVLRARVEQRTGDASDADVNVLAGQLKKDVGSITWHRINASGPPEQVAARVRQCLPATLGTRANRC